MDVTKTKPSEIMFWPGYNRGVIECNSCGYATPDDMARKGRIQKCAQCAKVLYIPSGLYRPMPIAGSYNYNQTANIPEFLLKTWDEVSAVLNKVYRSKYRWAIVFAVLLLGVGLIFGLNSFKTQTTKVVEKPSELAIYFDRMIVINKNLKNAELEYDLGVGGTPTVNEYNDRVTPNNRERFVRNTDRILKQIEGYLGEIQALSSSVPVGAESHYAKSVARLEEMQKYYARLKDGIRDKNEGRWKEAFEGGSVLREVKQAEEQALNLLQTLVLRPTTPKA